jgi:hypothetical protein
LAIPIALLCVKQFYSPTGSSINLGVGGALPPPLAWDVMRTTGVFASDAQHVSYIAFTLSLLAAALVGACRLRKESFVLSAGALATLTMMVVSGSRSIWFFAAAVALGAMAAAFLIRQASRARLRAATIPLAAGLVVFVLFATVFVRAYEAYTARNRSAGTFSEATVERVAGMFLPRNFWEVPLAGEGIGIATTGAAAVMTGDRALTLAENDWDRNLVELGLLGGSLLIILRVTFAIWLAKVSLRATRKGDAMALLLACFAVPTILVTPITMHTVYGHFAWFGAGLTMAAVKCASRPDESDIRGADAT